MARPQDDFYRHVNQHWLDENKIPKEYSSWSSFHVLLENNKAILKKILEKEENPRITKLYNLYIDGADGSWNGTDELKRLTVRIETQPVIDSLMQLHRAGLSPLFNLSSSQDRVDARKMIGCLGSGSLGLPSRDYYLEEQHGTVLSQYREHVTATLQHHYPGRDGETIQDIVDSIVEFETEMARHKITKEDRRDPEKTYNVRDLKDIPEGLVNWKEYLNQCTGLVIDQVNVVHPPYFEWLAGMKLDPRPYMVWLVVRCLGEYCDAVYQKLDFEFYSKTLHGQEEQKPVWKRALSVVEMLLGEELGKQYVKVAFQEEKKTRVLEMVTRIKQALDGMIQRLDWMSGTTKAFAQKKLERIVPLIGFPDRWTDTEKLTMQSSTLLGCVMEGLAFWNQDDWNKIGKDADPTEWHMTPQTVNAYYSPAMNQIVFPAGILQAPFFQGLDITDHDTATAHDYGAIGAVIGHEITHGFDDSGRKFDQDGNMNDWWTDEDKVRFESKARLVCEQYGALELFGVRLNGQLTLGENIADIGGIKIALQAYQLECKDRGTEPDLDAFFTGFASIWKNLITEQAGKVRIATDPHSPGEFRVNQALANIPEFIQHYQVGKGDAMWQEKQATIW